MLPSSTAHKVKSFARLRQTCHHFSETQAMALCSPGIALGRPPRYGIGKCCSSYSSVPTRCLQMLSRYFQTKEFAKTCLQRLEFAIQAAMIGRCCSLNSGQLSFETLMLLCYQSMCVMEKVFDLDIAIFNSSEMGGPSPGNVSCQNVQTECTNKIIQIYPSSARNQICMSLCI